MPADSNDIHRKALRAAAAVAMGVSGCSDPVASVQGTPAAAKDAAAEATVATDTASADTVPADVPVTDASAATDAEKAEAIADGAAVADAPADAVATVDAAATETVAAADGGGKPDCSNAQQGGNWAQCCEALRAWCDAAFGAGSKASTECQFGPNFDGSTGCTPWGPPAPPAWSDRVA